MNDVIGRIYAATADIPDATVFAMSPPMIAGYGMGNGFELYLQDKNAGDITAFSQVTDRFVEALSGRPEIGEVYSSFAADYPQYWVDIDAAKCEQSGVSPSDVLSTLSGYFSGEYVSNFNRFSKLYHVTMQLLPNIAWTPNRWTACMSVLPTLHVAVEPFCPSYQDQRSVGPDPLQYVQCHFHQRSPATGYSSGQVLKAIRETADHVLPSGYTYELGGLSREESNTTNNAVWIFVLCMVLIYLILCALYESVFIRLPCCCPCLAV